MTLWNATALRKLRRVRACDRWAAFLLGRWQAEPPPGVGGTVVYRHVVAGRISILPRNPHHEANRVAGLDSW